MKLRQVILITAQTPIIITVEFELKNDTDTGDKNPFVQIAKPTQNLLHLLSMWSNMHALQILSQILSLQKNM